MTQFGWTGFGNPNVDDSAVEEDTDGADGCFFAFGACLLSTIGR
jgi:hypothetical protein